MAAPAGFRGGSRHGRQPHSFQPAGGSLPPAIWRCLYNHWPFTLVQMAYSLPCVVIFIGSPAFSCRYSVKMTCEVAVSPWTMISGLSMVTLNAERSRGGAAGAAPAPAAAGAGARV